MAEEVKVEEEEEKEKDEDPMDAFYPQALAGFIMVMTEEGDMIYLTENVNKHIGITQVHTRAHTRTHCLDVFKW